MNDSRQQQNRLEQELVIALQRAPAIAIPEDFAVRCAVAVSGMPMERHSLPPARVSIGSTVAVVAAIASLIFLLWLAPHTRVGDPISLAAMDTACAYVIGIAVWLSSIARTTR